MPAYRIKLASWKLSCILWCAAMIWIWHDLYCKVTWVRSWCHWVLLLAGLIGCLTMTHCVWTKDQNGQSWPQPVSLIVVGISCCDVMVCIPENRAFVFVKDRRICSFISLLSIIVRCSDSHSYYLTWHIKLIWTPKHVACLLWPAEGETL